MSYRCYKNILMLKAKEGQCPVKFLTQNGLCDSHFVIFEQ